MFVNAPEIHRGYLWGVNLSLGDLYDSDSCLQTFAPKVQSTAIPVGYKVCLCKKMLEVSVKRLCLIEQPACTRQQVLSLNLISSSVTGKLTFLISKSKFLQLVNLDLSYDFLWLCRNNGQTDTF